MKKLVLGIDGGGTKTDLALANLDGEILDRVKAGPASLRNTGVDKSCENILKGFKNLPVKGELVASFVGLPAIQEECSDKKEYIEKYLSKGISGEITVGSDQLVAFKSGANRKPGVVVIAGTGGVVRGFAKETTKASGWGYFGDEGSAFWAGIKAYRAITKELDGRGQKTKITEMAFDRWDINSGNELNKIIYKNPMDRIPELSILVDYAQRNGDELAEKILIEAAQELYLSTEKVINELNLKDSFPLVAVGGMFKSEFLKDKFSKKIKEIAPDANIKKPEKDPVYGAVKLALENIK